MEGLLRERDIHNNSLEDLKIALILQTKILVN